MSMHEHPFTRVIAMWYLKAVYGKIEIGDVDESWRLFLREHDDHARQITEVIPKKSPLTMSSQEYAVSLLKKSRAKYELMKGNRLFMEWTVLDLVRREDLSDASRKLFAIENDSFEKSIYLEKCQIMSPAFLKTGTVLKEFEESTVEIIRQFTALEKAYKVDLHNSIKILTHYTEPVCHNIREIFALMPLNEFIQSSSCLEYGKMLFFYQDKAFTRREIVSKPSQRTEHYVCFTSKEDLKHQLEVITGNYIHRNWPSFLVMADTQAKNQNALSRSRSNTSNTFLYDIDNAPEVTLQPDTYRSFTETGGSVFHYH